MNKSGKKFKNIPKIQKKKNLIKNCLKIMTMQYFFFELKK